jgi:hypothetical protein
MQLAESRTEVGVAQPSELERLATETLFALPLERMITSATGTGQSHLLLLSRVCRDVTSSSAPLAIGRGWAVFDVRPLHSEEGSNLAGALKALTGLPAQTLAEVFHITRAAFHAWLRGVTPRGQRREHLAKSVQFVTEARATLGDAKLTDWLLTPVFAGGPRPLDLLARQDWYALKGMLQPTGDVRRPSSLGLPQRPADQQPASPLRAGYRIGEDSDEDEGSG